MVYSYESYGERYYQWQCGPHWIQLNHNGAKWFVIHAVYDGIRWNDIFIGNRYGYKTLAAAKRLYGQEVDAQYQKGKFREGAHR